MISILFFFVKRTRKLPFHYKYSVDRRHMFTFVWNHLIAEHFSDRWMPSNKTLIHQSKHSLSTNIPQELTKQIFICDLFAYRGQHPIVNFEDTFYLFLFFSLFNPSSTIYRFLERKGFMKRYDTTVFPHTIFKLYPSILCLEEKRFRLQVETVSGRLPWRLSRAGCIIHVFQAWIYMGIIPATLVYIAVDLQSRLLAAFPFVAEHRWFVAGFSCQFFFLRKERSVGIHEKEKWISDYESMKCDFRWNYWAKKNLNKISSYLIIMSFTILI